ncbi:MAG TPA: hypothetical protein PKA64_21875, partial [Myxococcota bacterium]|nr:hypothetical protein [Myxococcota bacterium]
MRAWIFSLVMVGCSEPATWYGAAGPIVEARCAGCHTDGGPAPMAFDSYEATARHAPVMAAAIRAGAMPPWQPAEGCNQYRGDLSLRPGERDLLLEYLDGDMPLGDPDAPPAIEVPVDPAPGVRPDVVLTLPEAYTPALQPDDYRCQIIPWPLAEPAYITGISVRPDRVQVVHHTIVFKAPADTLASWQALDDAEDGPGYTCFAGPGGAGFGSLTPDQLGQVSQAMQTGELPEGAGGTQWLGAWVPGASSNPFPEGSGLLIEPGDVVIVQMHYNTLASAPAPDQSSVVFEVASEVERRAWVAPFTDLGWVSGLPVLGEGPMVIPAGDPQV